MQKTGSPIADAVMDQDRQKDAGISQFWFLVLLIILIIGYAIFNPKPILFDWDEQQMMFNYPEGESVIIPFSEVKDIRFEEGVDFGECITGGEENGYSYGRWENNRWGKYELCAEIGLECAVVLETEDGIYALNAESYGTTKELARSLGEFLVEEGYLPGA